MAMNIDAAVKLTASVTGQQAIDNLTKSIGGLQGIAKTAGLALAGIGSGIGFSVLKDKFDDMVSSINNIKDASEKIGSTVEKFGALAQAAKITGGDMALLETGIIKINKALAGSDDDTKGAAHALDAIGLSIEKLRKLDPADAFTEIAKALDNFNDGGGKTAAVMDIFGKNGAQLLPFLKDYIEVGEQVSKVTQQQADDAEEYERNTMKLAAAKQELYRVINMQVLPVANAFVKSLLDMNSQTGGVREAVKGLAQDGTMTMVFTEAARAAAAFLDILSIIAKSVKQVGDSLAVVANDLITVAQIAMKAPKALFSGDAQAEIAELWRARAAFTQAANDDMSKRWSGSMTPFTDSLEKQLAQIGKSSPDKPRSNALSGYQSSVGTPKATGPSAFDTDMQSMARDASKFKWMAEHIQQYEDRITSAKEAQVQFDVEQGKFKDLTDVQKTQLLMQAAAVDKYAESLRQAKEGLAFDKQTQAIGLETRTIAMNTAEKQLAVAIQDLENRGIHEGTELFDKLIKKRKEAIDQAQAQKGDWFGGLSKGLSDYAEEAANVFGNVQKATTKAFKDMEDALVNFVKTGKMDFASLADSIVSDLIRIAIQAQITGPLAAAMKSGGLASFFGFADGGVMTANGALPLNTYANGGIANSPQMAIFGEGKTPEAYVPLPDGRHIPVAMQGSGGGNVVVNVVNNAGNATAKTQERQDSNGNRIIDVMIEQVKASIAADISRGVGTVTNALERTYGANRVAGAY